MSKVEIRRALETDADGIVKVWEQIARERIHSAIDRPFTVDEQRCYLQSLSSREAIFVAISESCQILGFQTLDLWAHTIHSMRHVAQLGTFLLPEWRHRGIGRALFRNTLEFARSANYVKFVIQVRASNVAAQSFYRQLGFQECGRLRRQVRIDGEEDDEILMELFL